MPSTTSIKQLVQDLRERKSEIARKFDKCSGAAWRTANKGLIEGWAPNTPLTANVGLADAVGLDSGEVNHINAWPLQEKIKARDAILDAINNDWQIEFFWDLNDDPSAAQSITDIGAGAGTLADPKKVTFVTPRSQVTKPGPTFGDVQLGV